RAVAPVGAGRRRAAPGAAPRRPAAALLASAAARVRAVPGGAGHRGRRAAGRVRRGPDRGSAAQRGVRRTALIRRPVVGPAPRGYRREGGAAWAAERTRGRRSARVT